MNTPSAGPRHYNPDWLDDDALVAGFVARQGEFAFLRDELARAPRVGSVQHHLLVGPRGSGKTTLLKRLAVAIRRDEDLRDHLVALSFPEELYQVKHLADFWWAACEALADELDRLGQQAASARLYAAVDGERAGAAADDRSEGLSDAGLTRLQAACGELGRRPVLLVDNLDLIFQRIDKSGRRLKDPHAAAYWALREALSTTTTPIVIGGSIRLSEPFTDYDKAFYDFFLPKRLGKLPRAEVFRVLDTLAEQQGVPQVKERLRTRPSRIDALYELTGGNPRALGLIFELLREGPSSRAVEDFERLMDITTPYYKARFEDLAEQAQVVMHALAVRRPSGDGLRFGHTAAEIGAHAGLATNTVSAQLDVLEREGLVEKNAGHGRTQYRIAEQLFRLWLQMRATRRIRQSVTGLSEFLEAMFDLDELKACLSREPGAGPLAAARLSFAVAGGDDAAPLRRGLEARGADYVLQQVRTDGSRIDDYLPAGDLSPELETIVRLRQRLNDCRGGGLTSAEQDALIGSLDLTLAARQASVEALCDPARAPEEVECLRRLLAAERRRLRSAGLGHDDLALLLRLRAKGYLPLPWLTVGDAEAVLLGPDRATIAALIWRLLGAREWVRFAGDAEARDWLEWGRQEVPAATSIEWANVAGAMRRGGRLAPAAEALDLAFQVGESARAWYERGALLGVGEGDAAEAEAAYRRAIQLDPGDAWPWNGLGILLADKLKRFDEAEAAYRRAIELDPGYALPWHCLGILLADKLKRFDEAEAAYRRAIELDPGDALPWNGLGILLADKLKRFDEAEAAYRRAIELDPGYALPWHCLGILLADKLKRFDEAEAAYRRAIELDPGDALPWNNLGNLLADKLKRFDEAEAAYRRAIELDPGYALPWNNLGNLLADKLKRFDEAEAAYRRAIELDPGYALPWNNLGNLLADKLKRFDEAEAAYRRAIELDPGYALPWNNLGNLLADKLKRFDEAEAAYRRAIELDPATEVADSARMKLGDLLEQQNRPDEAIDVYVRASERNSPFGSFFQWRAARLKDRALVESVRRAWRANDPTALREALRRLRAESADLAGRLVDEAFVEGVLAPALTQGTAARALLELLRELGFEPSARPLLLAFEAAIANRPQSLDALEPEVQGAARRMYQRLTGGGKPPADLSIG